MEKSKREIRKEILELRDGLSQTKRERGNILLTERILGHQWFYQGDVLLCFVSFGSEIDTEGIMQEAFRKGKRVYVPKIIQGAQNSEMRFFRIMSLEELEKGFKGIREPSGASEEYSYKAESTHKELMLMPGVAFDRCGGRIGYGGGYYDRFLQEKTRLQEHTIGVGYSCQLVDKLPMTEYDIRPYQVICV